MFTIHTQYTPEKRYAMTIFEQMGNISSEVGRALRAKASNNHQRLLGAIDAALELLYATESDPKNTHRRREVARSREVFLDYVTDHHEYGETEEKLDKYFTDFAIVARVGR